MLASDTAAAATGVSQDQRWSRAARSSGGGGAGGGGSAATAGSTPDYARSASAPTIRSGAHSSSPRETLVAWRQPGRGLLRVLRRDAELQQPLAHRARGRGLRRPARSNHRPPAHLRHGRGPPRGGSRGTTLRGPSTAAGTRPSAGARAPRGRVAQASQQVAAERAAMIARLEDAEHVARPSTADTKWTPPPSALPSTKMSGGRPLVVMRERPAGAPQPRLNLVGDE